MFVYVIVNSETLKIYVGQHKGNNLAKYLSQKISHAQRSQSDRSYLYASMRKHPKEVWSIHPLISELQTREECDYWEKLLIAALNAQNAEVGYNICRGGEGFTGSHSPIARQKMKLKVQAFYDAGGQAGMKGKQHTEEWKQQASIRMSARPVSEETKQKISETLMGHEVSEAVRIYTRELGKQQIGEKNPFFGKHHSEESKRKNAEAHRHSGRRPRIHINVAMRVVSEETRRKQSDAAKQRAQTPEGKARLQKAGRMSKPLRSAAHRKHLSESLTGRKASPAQLLHQSLAQKGKPKPPRSEEHRRHISEAQKARWAK